MEVNTFSNSLFSIPKKIPTNPHNDNNGKKIDPTFTEVIVTSLEVM